jgi:hypothetical protein
MNDFQSEKAIKLVDELSAILSNASDEAIGKLLRETSALDGLLQAILDPRKVKSYQNIANFLLANKQRSTVVALMR